MKKIVKSTWKSACLMVALAVGSGGFGYAQSVAATTAPSGKQAGQAMRERHHPDPARQTAMLTKRLSLTPEQAAQVEPILANRQQQMEALHASAPADPKAMHQQMRAIMQDTEGKLNAVFTEQQRTEFAVMKARRHEGHHEGMGHPAPGAEATPPPAM